MVSYEFHLCDVQVLAVHNVRFLTKTLHRLDPGLKRSNVQRCFEMAYDVECESCFGKRYVLHTCINHHPLHIFFSQQIIVICVIIEKELDPIGQVLVM